MEERRSRFGIGTIVHVGHVALLLGQSIAAVLIASRAAEPLASVEQDLRERLSMRAHAESEATSRLKEAASREAAGDLDGAIALVEQAIDAQPEGMTAARAHQRLGVLLRATGRPVEAEDHFEWAFAWWSHDASQHPGSGSCIHLARIRRGQGRTDESLALFERTIDLHPGNHGAHREMALLLRDLGRPAEAEAHFERAAACCERLTAIAPRWGGGRADLGRVRRDQGRTDDAIAAFEKAVEVDPSYPVHRLTLEQALARR